MKAVLCSALRKLDESRAESETLGRRMDKLAEAWDLGRLLKDGPIEAVG
jgi:hypothetical protein